MTNKNSKKLGFSLIELSIVILIIGILVAGVTQGSRLVGRSRLTSAKSLTQSSPVTGIKDLSTWFETTLDKSFKPAEAVDGTTISTWYDIQDVSNKITATSAGSAVVYEDNSINGLPTVRFASGGTGYFTLSDNGAFMNNTPYTAFYVARMSVAPASATAPRSILASSATAVGAATVGSSTFYSFVTATTYKICESNTNAANCSSLPTASYTFSTPTPHIISVVTAADATATNYTRSIYLNGTLANAPSALAQIPTITDLTIGKNAVGYFIGDIGEIIVFTRALTTPERQSVECYLGKKWGISGPTCS